jgi:peptide/nickel transport system substrate-binding protein
MSFARRRFLQAAGATAFTGLRPRGAAAQAKARTLRVALASLPDFRGHPFISTIAPFTMVTWSIFDSLTQIDASRPGGAVIPWLASSWERLEPARWRVSLRRDVTFTNGKPFTAESVVGTLRYVKEKSAPHFGVAVEMADIAEAKAEDAHTVVFTLKRPDPLFDRVLSVLPIVEHETLERIGIDAFALAPVGTGLYIPETLETTRAVFRANPNAWMRAPSERLELLAIGDSSSRLQALVSGAIDVSMTLEPEDGARVEAMGGTVYLSPINSVLLFLERLTGEGTSPLRDIRVRRALSHAINREAIAQTILGGVVKPASQLAPPGTLGHDPALTPAPYDPALARRLLTEAGYPDGFSFTAKVTVGAMMGDAPSYQQMAMDLAAIGVKMQLITVPTAALARDLRSGQWDTDAIINSYGADPLLDGLRAMRFNSCINPAPWVCDRTIQPVIDQAFAAADIEERERLTRQAIRHYREQEYGLLLYTNARLSGLAKRVKRFEATSARIRWDKVIVEDKA